jgi:ABC-type Fe3+ transport system substrate-binding protein
MGVMKRLLAEKNNPQADVYWANEPGCADVVRQQGISILFRPANAEQIPGQFKDPQGHWTGFPSSPRQFDEYSMLRSAQFPSQLEQNFERTQMLFTSSSAFPRSPKVPR